jgi:predicted permease
MSRLTQDVTYTFRTFRNSPGFVAVVVVSIAIGIAANTTIFSVANAVLFGGLPVRDADRLVNFSNDRHGSSFSLPTYGDLRESPAFEDIAAHFSFAPVSLNSERVWGQLVSGNYFSVIGVPMARGRGIRPEEDARRDTVVVLSYALWKRKFAGDPAIVGRPIVMNNQTWQVIGVAAQGFHGTDRLLMGEFWVPLSLHDDLLPEMRRTEERNSQWIMLDGRMKPGVSEREATAAINVINARIDQTYYPNEVKSRITLERSGRLPAETNRSAVGFIAGLMIVVGLVLVIACANVANLLLARGAGRQREIAVRLAVGASRARLVRQLVTESVMLSMLGAAAGLVFSMWIMAAISRIELPIPIPVNVHLGPDWRVLVFTIGLSLGSGIIFGLAPALRATRPDLVTAINGGEAQIAGFRRFGMRNFLVVTQVTLSLVLLISAGLFLRSLGRASGIELGMNPAPVLSVAFDPRQHSNSPELNFQFMAQVKERVAALPGVTSVSFTDFIPFSLVGEHGMFSAKGSASADARRVRAYMVRVDPGYFETMGIPLLSGRDFGHEAANGEKVAVINRAMAERLFHGQSPMGRQFEEGRQSYQVVGVCGNSTQGTLGEGDYPTAYVPLDQNWARITSLSGVALIAKSANPGSMLEPVRREIQALDPNLAVFNVLTMRDQTEKAMLLPRLTAVLFTSFGVSGLALAMVGLYGVMSFSVSRRTREIGIRMALGAGKSSIVGMVIRQGLALTGAGMAIGLVLALAASRFAQSLLYGVSPRDLETFVGVPLVLGAIALAASLIPARRASKTDPMQALRYE